MLLQPVLHLIDMGTPHDLAKTRPNRMGHPLVVESSAFSSSSQTLSKGTGLDRLLLYLEVDRIPLVVDLIERLERNRVFRANRPEVQILTAGTLEPEGLTLGSHLRHGKIRNLLLVGSAVSVDHSLSQS